MTSRLRVAQPSPVTPRALTTADYRELFGWSVSVLAGRALLNLCHDMVGVAVPASIGSRVVARVHHDDSAEPVLITGVESWVILADANGCVPAAEGLPPKVSVLSCPTRVPIPARDVPRSETRWARPPDPCQRWLPTLDAVLCVVRTSQNRGQLGLLSGSHRGTNLMDGQLVSGRAEGIR